MRRYFFPALLVPILLACQKTPTASQGKQYPFTGKILSINAKEHTAKIDGSAIPGFMEAMTMDYPVPSSTDLNLMKVGEQIKGTVNVNDDGSYTLSNVHPAAPAANGN